MHDKYSDIVQSLDPDGKFFRPANASEIAQLEHLRLPDSVLEFYRHHSPCKIIQSKTEEPIRLYPASGITEENRDYIPGCQIWAQGFVVFATTVYDDAYCFDLNANPSNPPVLLIGHEMSYEGCSVDEIRKEGVHAADNLRQFLERFRDNALVTDPYHESE